MDQCASHNWAANRSLYVEVIDIYTLLRAFWMYDDSKLNAIASYYQLLWGLFYMQKC